MTTTADVKDLMMMISRGESLKVALLGSYDETEIIATAVSLANSEGGYLMVGVGSDGLATGVTDPHDTRRVDALIADNTEPPVLVATRTLPLASADVLAIEVPKAEQVVSVSDGRYLWRKPDFKGRPRSMPMRPHEIMQRAESISRRDYSRTELPGLSMGDLSRAETYRFREMAKSSGNRALADLCDDDLLRALELVAPSGGLTVGALLLFGKEQAIRRWLPHRDVAFQESAPAQEHKAYESGSLPLLKAYECLLREVMLRNSEAETYLNLSRISLPMFSHSMVRELLANALTHRDYRSEAPTVVRLLSDVLVVSNPGGLPAGLGNLLTGPPRPRNPALAEAFKRAGIAERTRSGVRLAYAEQLSLGRSAPDYSTSNLDLVSVRVQAGNPDRVFASFLAEKRQKGEEFSVEDLLALYEIRQEKHISAPRAAELSQVGVHEARQTLDGLVARGYVEQYGKSRNYWFSLSFHRKLARIADRLHVVEADASQQERMVISYIESNGSIARREAAELCRMGLEAAGRLLSRLRDEGKLVLIGTKRSARYELP